MPPHYLPYLSIYHKAYKSLYKRPACNPRPLSSAGVEGGGGGGGGGGSGGGGGGDDSSLYATLNRVALGQPPSDLAVSPTLLGERHRPQLRGSVANAAAGNLSLGHVTRALCRGIVDNLTSMMPAALLGEAGVWRVLGCGSALSRNPALWEEAERALLPLPLERSQTADSAVGVAMVVCDRL